ncbi:MAG: sensor histidine kinase [Bacteroidota bacterium]|nr:sensor histidine kinase [Bacteroidota bacterium]
MSVETLTFRPFARLLTMLGDQLIKNERIALVELIRNAYDADADHVEIRFENFDKDMKATHLSHIVVRDDGTGMMAETLRNEWMRPATPCKFLAKKDDRGRTQHKNRVIQGEKGIGRFAVLKLGRKITITSRPAHSNVECVLTWDFSKYDDDFVSRDDQQTDIFLDDINVTLVQSHPELLQGDEHGTIIEIHMLNGTWGKPLIERLWSDISNLTDPVSRITRHKASSQMDVDVLCNGKRPAGLDANSTEKLKALIEDKAVLRIQGCFDCECSVFSYESESRVAAEKVALKDPKITGLWVWRNRFGRRAKSGEEQLQMSFGCGDFAFHFYIFDFARGKNGKYALTQADRKRIKSHRIYLYRDGVRVYPYGDPDDDWLAIDVTRGIGRAGNFFSNDQVIGWIDISQEKNPLLRDKTNREGLIESDGGAPDLIFLIQVFLSYLKQYPFARYVHARLQRSKATLVQEDMVASALNEFRNDLTAAGQKSYANVARQIEKDYKHERQHLLERAETTEDLAGVGLSVEMASHDIMLLLNRGLNIAGELARLARGTAKDNIAQLADRLTGVLAQVVEGMKDVQVLFKSSRRRRRIVEIEPCLLKVYHLYKRLLDAKTIRYETITKGRSHLVAKTTDGVVLQVLINLFDNAVYWLDTVSSARREILVTIDSDRGELIFSDSGPGVDSEDVPYIFDAFYSGKGQEGRGLGLYIARQLLERHDYHIRLGQDKEQILNGANFIVAFTTNTR